MKPEELRIGNWVRNIGGEFKIKSYDLNHFKSLNPQPIPITEQWLLEFGCLRNSRVKIGYIINEYPRLEINDGVLEIMSYCEDGEMPIELPHIKYIHQLQNLYYALTGEELKRKTNEK